MMSEIMNGPGVGDAYPPGTYTQTCRDITFTETSEGRWLLSAECQKADGSWQTSELTYDIANCDGQLTWAPTGC